MIGFLLMTLIFIGALVGLSKAMDFSEITNNWPKYRCRPDIMLSAGLYGYNTTDNLEFCLKNGFDSRASSAISPFYSYMGTFVSTLVTLLGSINSIRMTFATIIGSVTQIFGEFSGRIQALFYRLQYTAIRIKFLMSRIFATMYSVIFMGMSGIKATQNFSNTALFSFLDFICFDPDTPVNISGKGTIPIKDVVEGDIFEGTKDRVTSLFRFLGDGQEMTNLKGCIVSTNHYVLYKGHWIEAGKHPDAVSMGPWTGGVERPLICFNTSTHEFPVNGYIFRDYDETEEGDFETMKYAIKSLNGKETEPPLNAEYSTCCHPDTEIRLENGSTAPAKNITLGTRLSHGQVVGLVKKECTKYVPINGEKYGSGTALWSKEHYTWKRAAELGDIKTCEPIMYISFMVTPGGNIETAAGTMFRDYFEVHQPDMEKYYEKALCANMTKESDVVQTEC